MTELNVATREDFEAACSIAKDLAQDVYTRTPDLPPAGLVFSKTDDGRWDVGIIDMAPFFAMPVGKQMAVAMLNQLMQDRPSVLLTCLLSEAWRVERPVPADGESVSMLPPSEDPNRIECLMLNVLSRESQAVKALDIDRSAEDITLKEGDLVFVDADTRLQGNMIRPNKTVH